MQANSSAQPNNTHVNLLSNWMLHGCARHARALQHLNIRPVTHQQPAASAQAQNMQQARPSSVTVSETQPSPRKHPHGSACMHLPTPQRPARSASSAGKQLERQASWPRSHHGCMCEAATHQHNPTNPADPQTNFPKQPRSPAPVKSYGVMTAATASQRLSSST